MLTSRLKVALPLTAIVLVAFFVPGLIGQCCFVLFCALMIVAGIREIFTMCSGESKYSMLEFLTDALVLFGLGAIWYYGRCSGDCECSCRPLKDLETVALVVWVIAASCCCLKRQPDGATVRLFTTGFFAVVLCQMLLMLPRMYFMAQGGGRYCVFFLVLLTKLSDVGGYVAGSMTSKLPGGNHKLAKAVSPKKSWEGLGGSIIFSLIAAVIAYLCLGDNLVFQAAGRVSVLTFGWLDVIFLGITLPVIGLFGDLMESMIKRAAGVKDSGHIPGLGGVLDILDSLILAVPFTYVWLLLRQSWI